MTNSRVLMVYFALILNVIIILVSHLPNAASSKSHSHSHSHSRGAHHHHSLEINPSGRHATLTLNNFAHGGDGGGPSECDGKFHPLPQRVVALSTGLYENGKHCGRMIRIKAGNGRSTVAKVVDECDSRHGCKNNIVDGSQTVWHDLGLNTDDGEVPVTWTIL